MLRRLAMILAFGGLCGAAPASAQVDLKVLLEGLAVQSESLGASFETGEFEARTRVQELDDDGKVVSDRRTVDRIEQIDGKPEPRLISAIEDGEDISEKVKEERAERQEKARKKAEEEGKKRGDFPNPFRGAVARDYRFEIAGPAKGFPGALKIAFAPKGKPKKELFVGEAVVDPVARRLLLLSARPSKYPFGLDEMAITVAFAEAQGRPVIRRIVGQGKGGLPFMKKRFRFESEFVEWRFPAAPGP